MSSWELLYSLQFYQMNILNQLQHQYDKLWKYIIRPSRRPYSEQLLGPELITIKQREFRRKDFQLTNKRGYDFSCSLWFPNYMQQYPCVIYLHGNSSNRIEGTEYLRRLLINNIGLCTFDFSGCGNAQGQFVSLGYYEQEDLKDVIEYLRKSFNISSIALWGRSMGAVTALLYLAKHQGVQCLVVDSPFKSLKALVEDMAKKSTNIPNLILSGAFKIISGTVEQKAGFSIYDLNPFKNVVPHLNLPAFFIVGINDEVIPLEHTKDLFQEFGGDQKYIKMVKGGHNQTRPKECIRSVIKFLLSKLTKPDQSNNETAFKEQKESKSLQRINRQELQQKQQVPQEQVMSTNKQ